MEYLSNHCKECSSQYKNRNHLLNLKKSRWKLRRQHNQNFPMKGKPGKGGGGQTGEAKGAKAASQIVVKFFVFIAALSILKWSFETSLELLIL